MRSCIPSSYLQLSSGHNQELCDVIPAEELTPWGWSVGMFMGIFFIIIWKRNVCQVAREGDESSIWSEDWIWSNDEKFSMNQTIKLKMAGCESKPSCRFPPWSIPQSWLFSLSWILSVMYYGTRKSKPKKLFPYFGVLTLVSYIGVLLNTRTYKMNIYLSVCLSVYRSLYLFIHLFIYHPSSIRLSIYVSHYMSSFIFMLKIRVSFLVTLRNCSATMTFLYSTYLHCCAFPYSLLIILFLLKSW